METHPSKLEIAADGALQITWNDGMVQRIAIGVLRNGCPCATCREKRKEPPQPTGGLGLQVISLAEAQPLAIRAMRPVGNYAYGIDFSDGHDTGIYTLELLRSLGDQT